MIHLWNVYERIARLHLLGRQPAAFVTHHECRAAGKGAQVDIAGALDVRREEGEGADGGDRDESREM